MNKFTLEYMQQRYNECMQRAALYAQQADTFRATSPQTWLSHKARAQAIREAQDEAEVFYLAAQQYYAQEAA